LVVDGATTSVGNLTVPNINLGGLLTAPNINVGTLTATSGLSAPSSSTFGGNPLSSVINTQARSLIRSVFRV
jgi:hypothetical protein